MSVVKKKIAIDATAYVDGRAPGFNNYLLALLEGVAEYWTSDYEIVLFIREDQLESFEFYKDKFKIKCVRITNVISRVLWQNLIFPFLSLEFYYVFFPANFAPFLGCRKYLLVVCDLNFLIYPNNFSYLAYWYRRLFIKRSIIKAEQCVAISDQVKAEIYKYCGVTPVVVHIPVRAPSSMVDFSCIPEEISRVNSIIIVPASLAVHKNVYAAYDAALSIVKQHDDIAFVFFGGWSIDDFLVEEHHQRISILGYIDESTRSSLFTICCAALVPSLYEGFGIPYIETLLIKKALICCDIPVAREVTGDSPFYINSPYGAKEIADAVMRARSCNFFKKNNDSEMFDKYSVSYTCKKFLSLLQS